MGPRDVLNKLKWHPDLNLKGAKVTIVHRGAPRDRRTLDGENILDLGTSFMKVKRGNKEVEIPYHRIRKIETPEEVIWQENSRTTILSKSLQVAVAPPKAATFRPDRMTFSFDILPM